jgi:hypothetical protein
MLPASSAKAYGYLKASAPSKLYGQAAIMHSFDNCGGFPATGRLEVLTRLQAGSGSPAGIGRGHVSGIVCTFSSAGIVSVHAH